MPKMRKQVVLIKQDRTTEREIKKVLSWRALILRIFVVYIFFSIASHNFSPYFPTGHNWTPAEYLIGSFVGYFLLYMLVFVITSLIAILIARIPKNNRMKPLQQFINGALIGTVVVSMFMVYGGWYAKKKGAEFAQKKQNEYEEILSQEVAEAIKTVTPKNHEGTTYNSKLSVKVDNILNKVADMMARELPNRLDRATIIAGISYSSTLDTLTYRIAVDRGQMIKIFEEENGITPDENEMDVLMSKTFETLSKQYACNGLRELDSRFKKENIHGIYSGLKIKYIYIMDGDFHKYIITGKTCND